MSDEREGMLPSLRALGDSLGEAARREMGSATAGGRAAADGPRPERRLRGHGRLLGVVAGLTLAATGAATAGDLIGSGEPAAAPEGVPADVRPSLDGASPILLRAADPEAGGAWGVRTYRSAGGASCVVGGWIRGQSLGVVEGGVFRPYSSDERGAPGACTFADGEGSGDVSLSTTNVTEPAPRTLVFGQAGADAQRVTVDDGEDRHVARVTDGIFLLVLDGSVERRRVKVVATD